MTRRFRRRPSTTVFALLALAVVILARSTYDRIVDRPGLAAPGFLQEGGCELVRVIDGDSIVVRQTVTHPAGGKRMTSEATIRLLGIDCPEFDEPWGTEATTMTRRLLDEGAVTLRLDRRRLDRYERVLAYVFVNDLMVNAALVRAGLARADVYPGDSQSMGRIFDKAEAEAKADRRGIWGPVGKSLDPESSRGR
ncbi:MAG: thermonuclease family protein, partial [Pirellulaceae bacterium]|jgi:micrococcal nuclease|nr:thermonuclease family protein [Pirellulaceae bacterium]MDP6720485.1 thermonuclease family protein [Pirellulaceae bacterium]